MQISEELRLPVIRSLPEVDEIGETLRNQVIDAEGRPLTWLYPRWWIPGIFPISRLCGLRSNARGATV